MPKIADLEMTPNPNARKFILKEPLTYGVARSYESAEEARDDELASQLFAVEHVTSVFYVDNWLTVTQDGHADWQQLMRTVAGPIREAPAAAGQSEEFSQAAQWLAEEESPLSETDRKSPQFEKNVSCPRCYDRLTPERRASLEERGRQIELAAARGEKHIGSR